MNCQHKKPLTITQEFKSVI